MTPADALILGVRRALGVLLIAVLVRSLPYLTVDAGLYRPAWAEWLGFALLAAATVVITAAVLTNRELGASRGPLLVAVLAASVISTAAIPPDQRLSSAHWSWFIIGWFIVSILFGERTAVVAGALGLHLALVLTQVALSGPVDRLDLVEFAIRTMFFTGGQLAFGVAAEVARRFGRSSERLARGRARALTERRIAEQLMADDQARHSALATTAIPLLEGLSSGRLDPQNPDVRRHCRIEATRLRRRMAEADRAPDPLEHELRACVDLAERAGLQVDVSYRGTGPEPDLQTRRRLTEPVIAALAEARDRARVTVVESPLDVVVSVVADTTQDDSTPDDETEQEGTPAMREEDVDDVTVEVVRTSGRIWVTARWSAA